MRKLLMRGAMAVVTCLTPALAEAQTDPSYPNYRIRYLADIIDRDDDGDRLIEEGVFNTIAQANEVINILAHLVIAWHVDCACEEIRRDVIGVNDLEEDLMERLSSYGYVSRLVSSSDVGSLPPFVAALTPYLILNGSGFREDNNRSYRGGSTMTLDPSNSRQYARVDPMGVFVDTRLSGYVADRVSQLLGGYLLNDATSLCAFAALERSPDDMMSWVLIPDLRSTWSGEGRR